MLKIGDFSKLSRISIRMLRHYDEMGLLTPESVDDFTSYRYYCESQLPTAEMISVLKSMGFSLAVVKEILTRYENPLELEQKMRLLDSTIKWLRKDGSMMSYHVTLKTLPERQAASVRQIIPAYNQEGILWNILMKETAAMRITDGNPCYTLAIFHDGAYKEEDVDVEIQKTVIGDYKDTEHVKFKIMPPVEIASVTYKGSYEQITAVNEAVANWIVQNGYEFAGLHFCIYHVSPCETQNPDELVTEVCYPVKKKA